MQKARRSLWRVGERVGRQGEVTSDQPWFYPAIAYDDPEHGARLESVCHFPYEVAENLPDSDDPVANDRTGLWGGGVTPSKWGAKASPDGRGKLVQTRPVYA